jgi:pyridoxamine 5'-phosphate oxidase
VTDPLSQFLAWLDDAAAAGVPEPTAMTLATASADGVPSARMVLLKGADEAGFRFFTNYRSAKGRDLEANARAALVFHWQGLGRQVRVTGAVERLTAAESDAYFVTRPRGSRISAAASPQSEVIAAREELLALVREITDRHPDGDVPRPEWWGGYLLRHETVEFWTHRDDRLHDRVRHTREGAGWRVEILAP